MTTVKKESVKTMFEKALKRNEETIEDIIFISHPLGLLEEISAMEEIHCFYLNGAWGWHIDDSPEKQLMPFFALTHKNFYYYNEEDPYGHHLDNVGQDPGVKSFSRDDIGQGKWSEEYLAERQKQAAGQMERLMKIVSENKNKESNNDS